MLGTSALQSPVAQQAPVSRGVLKFPLDSVTYRRWGGFWVFNSPIPAEIRKF